MTNTIGDYEVYEELGRGGMAVVYRALDTHTGQIVALKVLRGEVADEPEALARLSREGRTANQLNHPNIVRVFDYGESGGQLFIAMECVQGETLSQRLVRDFQFTEAETQRITLAVARALDAAYQHGVVHRDIKPANVLLSKTGEVKVSDFGLARAVGTRTVTQRGAIVGTLAYMSPEVLDGKEDNIRRDLYALGVMMYEMLTGLTPFEAKSESEMLKKKLSERPDLRPLRRASEKLAPIAERLIRTKPDERYPTPAAVIEALEGQTDLQDTHAADLTKPLPSRLRSSASGGWSSITRLPRQYKLGAAGLVALVGAGVATLVIAGAFGGGTTHPVFSSSANWQVYEPVLEATLTANGTVHTLVYDENGLPKLGRRVSERAREVCLRADFPPNCPETAYRYERPAPGGWEIPESILPDARWIWAPVNRDDIADDVGYLFTTTFEVSERPKLARIAITADSKATVFVNGEKGELPPAVGANTVLFWDISYALQFGPNIIVVYVKNDGPEDFDGPRDAYVANCKNPPCTYRDNAAGFVMQGPLDWE